VLAEYQTKTNIGVGLGLVLEIAGRILTRGDNRSLGTVGSLVILVGVIAFIWGCAQYCRGKGHSPWWGAFGLLSILGLIVLFFLPDRHKQASA